MQFKEWLKTEGLYPYRDVLKVYRDLMQGTPENLKHHPEGNSWEHVKLVFKAIYGSAERNTSRAARELERLKADPSMSEILAAVDFSVSPEEQKVLNLSAFLHDVAKPDTVTADGQKFLFPPGEVKGLIQAIGHDSPKYYVPRIEKLKAHAPEDLLEFYESHKDLIHFLIDRHMDHIKSTFPKDFLSSYFDNGRLKSDQRVKLLLILMWADMLGRAGSPDVQQGIDMIRSSSERSLRKERNIANQKKSFTGGAEEFRSMLASKGLPPEAIDAAVKSKFGV